MGLLQRLLHVISLLITASAAVVLFIAVPFVLLDNRHLIPSSVPWGVVFLFFPFVYIWGRAGLFLLVVVTVCESAVLSLKPGNAWAKITAVAPILACLLTYLLFHLGWRWDLPPSVK